MSINRKLFPSMYTSTRSVEGSRLYANPSQLELNSRWLNKNLANSNRNEQKLMYKRTHKIQILFFSHGFPWRYNVQRIENILKCLKTTNLRTTCLYINPLLTRVTSIIHEPTGTQECIMNYNRRSECQQFCDKLMLRLQYTVLTCCDVKTWSKHSQASFRGDQHEVNCIESLMIA